MVSIPIPNHTIQFWIQFKTSGSYLQGLERWDPHHLSNHMTTFTPCLLIHWLTMLSVPRLFLKALRKGNFFIAVKGQKDRLLFSISKHSFEILLSPDPIFFFFFFCAKSDSLFIGTQLRYAMIEISFHFRNLLNIILISLMDIYLNYNLFSNSTSLLRNSSISIQGIKKWLRIKRSKRVKSCL